jgi:type IV pilus assembly protein PilE
MMNSLKQTNAGVTLLELMMVVAIVGILAAVAIPSYRAYVLRANRADAKRALVTLAADFERCFTRNNTYKDGGTTAPTAPCLAATSLPDASSGTYSIEADVAAGGIKDNSFALRAVPIRGQVEDTKCGTFQLNDTNTRTVSGSSTAQECWGR